MKLYTYSTAGQRLAEVLEEASREGTVITALRLERFALLGPLRQRLGRCRVRGM